MARLGINGASVEYFDEGRGQPIVLIHGSASDYRTWAAQRGAFSSRFRVVTYSRRYHWPNEPIAEGADYSMSQQVDDLQALLEALDASPAHLVGHSYGGLLCLHLAMTAPRLVRTMVLAEPPAITLFVSSRPRPLEMVTLLATRPRTALALMRLGATGIAPATRAFEKGETEAGISMFGDAVFGRGGYDRLPESRKAPVRDNRGSIKAELLGSGFLPLDAESVRGVRCPTLLATGERSITLFHLLADRLEELLPRAERIRVAGVAHSMHEDNPSAFNAAVLSFIDAHLPAT